jgi:glycine dehydrogenase subunit 2
VLARISEEAYADPELVRTAPHNQAIAQVTGAALDDPAAWAMTWRAYLRKHRGAPAAAAAPAPTVARG